MQPLKTRMSGGSMPSGISTELSCFPAEGGWARFQAFYQPLILTLESEAGSLSISSNGFGRGDPEWATQVAQVWLWNEYPGQWGRDHLAETYSNIASGAIRAPSLYSPIFATMSANTSMNRFGFHLMEVSDRSLAKLRAGTGSLSETRFKRS